MRIAILGAECTGKTRLAQALCERLAADISPLRWEPEYLRAWCDAQQRTPQAHEQMAIAQEQMARILRHPDAGLLLCDTTPLMTAVYSEIIWGDRSLYAWALEQQAFFALTLLTAPDLPWVADGFQRDGVEVRDRVDQRLREVLLQHRIAYASVSGVGPERTEQARLAILSACGRTPVEAGREAPGGWKWECGKCSDPDCEHRLFSSLLGSDKPA